MLRKEMYLKAVTFPERIQLLNPVSADFQAGVSSAARSDLARSCVPSPTNAPLSVSIVRAEHRGMDKGKTTVREAKIT